MSKSEAATPRYRRKPGGVPWFASVPALIIAALFTIGPLLVVIAMSFMTRPAQGGGVVYEFTTDAYRTFLFTKNFTGDLVFNTAYVEVFWRSIVQATITTVISFVFAFPLALWIATRSAKLQNFLVLVVTIPFWTNLLVRTYAWILVLNKDGIINQTSLALGLGPQELLYTDLASQLGLIYTFLPFMVLPLYSSLSGFDFRLAEAAYDLGARKMTVLRRVI
ncbi:MAG TPA: ABC transporter permease, partial [Propionibacteriaceae bacterium]|nr:ABC transporter permease [Propionibacteriaceae bacterium]